MKNNRIIYLVGMPGSGKSYFGRKLAEVTGLDVLDMDKAIEEEEGRTITDIFSQEGEQYFRQLESNKLKELTLSHQGNGAIISTGGGTPCFHEGMRYMNTQGVTVFLETEMEVLLERLSAKTHRPLVQGDVEQKTKALLAARLPTYHQAHISIAHRDAEALMTQIEEL